MSLRWEEQGPAGWWGYSGKVIIAQVGQRTESGRWWWLVSGVHTKHIVAGEGERKEAADARRGASPLVVMEISSVHAPPIERGGPPASDLYIDGRLEADAGDFIARSQSPMNMRITLAEGGGWGFIAYLRELRAEKAFHTICLTVVSPVTELPS